ncbi:MAG: transglutaminase domain-containing protein [Actinomycetota bacterium]|nr:transglutaminase domain-containing protein [Actinomycetota bacterium]
MSDASGANSGPGPMCVRFVRRLVPYSLLPLALIACFLASAPWLRAFPAAVMAVPLVGAALIAVLLPVVVIAIGIRKLWLTALIDVIGFVFFTTLVTLREPVGFADLYTGHVHGPSQILTFALPLVSPRTLLVAPIALCWISGIVIGECLGRGWQSVLPYATLLVTFGLAYAATTRAITSTSDGHRYDTMLAGGLLLTLLLLRAAQAWIEQDIGAETSQPDGMLPLRGLAIGAAISAVIALLAGAVVQASVFSGRPAAPERVPPLDRAQPLTPLAFVAGLRPVDLTSDGTELFRVTLDRRASRYVAIADVDTYDGDGWSFHRTFRPSGGVVPADQDPTARATGVPVTQQYQIDKGAMTTVPWMPFQYRPEKITGTSVNIDATSGMVVPSRWLRAGELYSVRSATSDVSFSALPTSTLTATSPPPADTYLPPSVKRSLADVVQSLQNETQISPTNSPIVFLQAVLTDFRNNYALSGGPNADAPGGSGPVGAETGSTTRAAPVTKPPAKPSPKPSSPSSSPGVRTGGTSFANVLASILGPTRSATPEQYATLVALVARQLGVPARVVSGFRIGDGAGATVGAGTYRVTTKQAWSWGEVPIRGRGWVVLDPSPGTYSNQKPQPSLSARPTASQTPSSTPNALLTQNPSNGGNGVAKKSRVPQSNNVSTTSVVLVAVALVIALLLLLALAFVLRKRLRARRRRRVGDPRRRLVGAWQEGLDVLVESGLPDVASLTSAEVAAITAEHFGNESAVQARYLGDSANAAIFSPTSRIGQQEADAAWRAQFALRKSVRRRLTFRERVGAGLRYHHTRKPRPLVGPASWTSVAKARVSSTGNRGKHSSGRRRRVH